MAQPRKVTLPPVPTSDTPSGGSGRGLTGFRRYNPDGTWTLIPFGDNQPIGGMPRFSGDILGDPGAWTIPLYYDGDENAPYDANPEESYGLQLALVRAGYMSKSSLSDLWTGTATNAYKRALEDANRYGIPVDQLLGAVGDGNAGSGSGSGSGLPSASITDDDIRAIAQKTAKGVLGRNLRDDELASFIPSFRGVIDAGTSPTVGAEDLIRQQTAPVEAGAHDLGNAFDVFGQLLGGR